MVQGFLHSTLHSLHSGRMTNHACKLQGSPPPQQPALTVLGFNAELETWSPAEVTHISALDSGPPGFRLAATMQHLGEWAVKDLTTFAWRACSVCTSSRPDRLSGSVAMPSTPARQNANERHRLANELPESQVHKVQQQLERRAQPAQPAVSAVKHDTQQQATLPAQPPAQPAACTHPPAAQTQLDLYSPLCELCSSRTKMGPRADHCKICNNRMRRIRGYVTTLPHNKWRADLVKAKFKTTPAEFWDSLAWKGRMPDAAYALLGADCFGEGGVCGPLTEQEISHGVEVGPKRPLPAGAPDAHDPESDCVKAARLTGASAAAHQPSTSATHPCVQRSAPAGGDAASRDSASDSLSAPPAVTPAVICKAQPMQHAAEAAGGNATETSTQQAAQQVAAAEPLAQTHTALGMCKLCGREPRDKPRTEHCGKCGRRLAKVREYVYMLPNNKWRAQPVKDAIKSKPVEFWESAGWASNMPVAAKALLGLDCFEPGGVCGPLSEEEAALGITVGKKKRALDALANAQQSGAGVGTGASAQQVSLAAPVAAAADTLAGPMQVRMPGSVDQGSASIADSSSGVPAGMPAPVHDGVGAADAA